MASRFSISSGVPNITRSTNIPPGSASIYMRLRVQSYVYQTFLFKWQSNDGRQCSLYTGASTLYWFSSAGGENQLWTDGYADTFELMLVGDSALSTYVAYYKRRGEQWSAGSSNTRSALTNGSIWLGSDVGGTSGSGAIDYYDVKIWGRVLKRAEFDLDEVRFRPRGVARNELYTWLQFAGVAPQIDYSDAGPARSANWTLSGTPTTAKPDTVVPVFRLPPVARAAASGNAYTLQADTGSFALTGEATGLRAARRLVAATGDFTETGNDTTLRVARKVIAATASFAVTGEASGLRTARVLALATGVFTHTGEAALLKPGRLVAAASAAFTLTGGDAALSRTRAVLAASGAFAHAGQNAGLALARLIAAAQGSVTLTGNDAGLRAGVTLSADAGAFAQTGLAAVLLHGSRVAADAGTFAVGGQATGLRAQRRITAATAAFAVTGNDAALSASGDDPNMPAESGAFAMTGNDAAIRRAPRVVVDIGTFSQVGQNAATRVGRYLAAAAAVIAMVGEPAAVREGRRVAADVGTFVETGIGANLVASRRLSAAQATLLATGHPAELVTGDAPEFFGRVTSAFAAVVVPNSVFEAPDYPTSTWMAFAPPRSNFS